MPHCRKPWRFDPLDIGARCQKGIAPANGQACLDLAFDLMRSGLHEEARNVLQTADIDAHDGYPSR